MPGQQSPSEARWHTPGLFVSTTIDLAKQAILELVFPPRCLGCDRVDWAWCPRCMDALNHVPLRPRQRKIRAMTIVATGDHTGLLMLAVQALKYEKQAHLAAPLAQRITTLLERTQWQPTAVIPVPMPTARKAQRGYNQAKLLTDFVAASQGVLALPDAIIRTRETPTQVGLSRQQRIQNVRGAFQAQQDLSGQRVLLIDDVLTTGATLAACAQAAAQAGATAILGLTVTAAASTHAV